MPITDFDLFQRALGMLGEYEIALEADKTATATTAANPVVVSVSAHGYAAGDLVLLRGFAHYANQLSDRVFEVDRNPATNTFALKDEDGTLYPADTTGGTVARLTGQAGGSGNNRVTRVIWKAWPRVRDEVLRAHPWNGICRPLPWARYASPFNLSAVTKANPAVVTTTSPHGFVTGDTVLIQNIVGMIELNDRAFTVGTVTSTTFQLASEDSTNYQAWVAGGVVQKMLQPRQAPFQFAFRYALPADLLDLIEVSGTNGFASNIPTQLDGAFPALAFGQVPKKVDGNEVYSDLGPTLNIRYIRKQYDPKQYDSLLQTALAARLAYEICEPITNNPTKRSQALADYNNALEQAKRRNAQENGPPVVLAEDAFVLARF